MKVSKGKPIKAAKTKSSKPQKKAKTQYVIVEYNGGVGVGGVMGPFATAEMAHDYYSYGGIVKRLEAPTQF